MSDGLESAADDGVVKAVNWCLVWDRTGAEGASHTAFIRQVLLKKGSSCVCVTSQVDKAI